MRSDGKGTLVTARVGGVAIREGVMPIHVFKYSRIKKLTSRPPKTQEPRKPPVVLVRAIGNGCGLLESLVRNAATLVACAANRSAG